MTTATRSALRWQSTARAIYVRGPSSEPELPHLGVLYAYAIRQANGEWTVVDRTTNPATTAVAGSRDAARLLLERIGAAHREAT